MSMKKPTCFEKNEKLNLFLDKYFEIFLTLLSCTNAYYLHDGEVAFPPEIFLHVGAHGRQGVVQVHPDVDERVDQRVHDC